MLTLSVRAAVFRRRFPADPSADVARKIPELDSFGLALHEEPDRGPIHEIHLFHVQDNFLLFCAD